MGRDDYSYQTITQLALKDGAPVSGLRKEK